MRNKITLLLFGLIFSSTLFGQKFSMKILGGLTSSQISGDGIYGFAQFGGILGAETSYKIKDHLSASIGLQFNQKGARNYQSSSVYSAYRLRVNYLEVPFTLNYQIDRFTINPGLYFGVKINQKERNTFGAIEPYHEFKPFDFGLQLGVAYTINDNWDVEGRFQNSILPVRNHANEQAYPPALFVFGTWHQKMLSQGQFFTSLSLVLKYRI
ncbi:porin family protein [Brumimicrobium aurantiacum]|uniref:PorT family protein n=1 Tax=Brumimicrobium aurantiacum TaxID=1737063 RepID=A0A3E1EVB7_9FLAO|nr:porin family protein [Brumimicrobium aurantiacum]RFC53497.1 PorT family protein [Brumimicrobium aurantiacum]